MKQIQEKRLETELQSIQTEKTIEIGIKINKNNRDEYSITITIPKLLSLEKIDIDLLLIVKQNYPFNPPKLYFISKQFFPHLSDGRDMVEDVLFASWSPQCRLLDLIEKIPKFIIEYSTSLFQGTVLLTGNYFLGEHYDISFLEHLPVYSKKIKERVMIKGKPTDRVKLLLISDLYFCLYEIDQKIKGNAVLTFWSNIRALINIRILVNDNLCKFVWRDQLENQKMYELLIITANGEEIQRVILDNMSKLGINYNVNKRNSELRTGTLPPTDILIIENQIEELEKEVQLNPKMEKVKQLMDLYEDAVEFYSAIDNPRYALFTKKIQEILNAPEMMELLSKDAKSQTVLPNIIVNNKTKTLEFDQSNEISQKHQINNEQSSIEQDKGDDNNHINKKEVS